MANNRMYLMHRPSGLYIYLGKRLANGWFDIPDNLGFKIEQLHRNIWEEGYYTTDDFCIGLEDATGAPMAMEITWTDDFTRLKKSPRPRENTKDC